MIKEIDHAIAEILEISELEAEEMRTMVKLMMERRLARAGEARREAIRGREEEKMLRRPRRRKRRKRESREIMERSRLNNFM